MLENFELVEISAMMVLESVDDKWCFSTLSFVKSKLKNWLTTHFDLVVRIFALHHYSMDTFTFRDAIKDWQDR